MEHRELRALMCKKGVTNVLIANKTGVSPTWVSLVLCSHKKSHRIRRAIARAVGKRVKDIWPAHPVN